MKYLILLCLFMLSTAFTQVREKCSLKNSMIPKCYHKRDNPILKIALVSYGSNLSKDDLIRIEGILKERFYKATNQLVAVDIIIKKVMEFKQPLPVDYQSGNINDPERLHRIWYYENVNAKVMQEVYEEFKKVTSDKTLDELDAILAITGAQFEGLEFASGRVSATESPREIA